MGLFSNLKKEMYINKLVTTYKLYYNCGDMAAIMLLRENYSSNELKTLVKDIKNAIGGKTIFKYEIDLIAPFKEDFSVVQVIDLQYGGK